MARPETSRRHVAVGMGCYFPRVMFGSTHAARGEERRLIALHGMPGPVAVTAAGEPVPLQGSTGPERWKRLPQPVRVAVTVLAMDAWLTLLLASPVFIRLLALLLGSCVAGALIVAAERESRHRWPDGRGGR